MERPDFDRCTIEATKLLYEQDLSGRILDIQKLKYSKNIIFDSIQNYCTITHRPLSDFISEKNQILNDGCTLRIRENGNDLFLILYNNQITKFEHLNWTLAHEVGHIYLGHEDDGHKEEIEAHFFASQLFMPEYSIHMMFNLYKTLYPEDISEIFGVSYEASQKRLGTMTRKTSVFSGNPHKEIWERQKYKIDLYFLCKKNQNVFRSTLGFYISLKNNIDKQFIDSYAQ